MNAPKFTPGPWVHERLNSGSRELVVKATQEGLNGNTVVATRIPGPEAPANAHLIAAAPDMHKALVAAGHALRSYQFGNAATDLAREIADACEAAVAKAEGRQT